MLDPDARALLDLMVQRGVPPTHTMTPTDARRFYRERRAVTQPEPMAIAEVRDLRAETPGGVVPLRLYRPAAAPARAPALVYYHGGGWTIGDLDTHDVLCRELAERAACVVVAVDYRLAPEHRFPAAVDDSLGAARWVHANAAALGIDASRLALGGDSAGGNLATVTAIGLRDSAVRPVFQLLIYPATDMRAIAPSHQTNAQGYLLTADSVAYYRGHYIAEVRQHDDWRASPLLHADLSKLPPALVLTAGFDPLRDEGIEYAQRLTQAGNRATHISFERQIHGFILMGRVIDEANAAVATCAAQLKAALAA
jgi:acetyl esterase